MSSRGQTQGLEACGKAPVIDVRMTAFDERCPYLKEKTATLEGFFASQIVPDFYRRLMDVGFRRSGRFLYHTACAGCSECVPIRVLAKAFAPSRSQRRCGSHNRDLRCTVGEPELTKEKFDLYVAYLRAKHSDSSDHDVGALYDFLYNPVVETREFCYRDDGGRLLAVGICDVFADALSSVYCYYDVTQMSRGLGTFSAITEIEYARQMSLAYYYLGFLVGRCPAMAYKASYHPYELLEPSCGWVASDVAALR